MYLHELIKKFSRIIPNILLRDLTLDSREVKPGDLFIALKGSKLDGKDYISQAISRGAVAVVTENEEGLSERTIFFSENKKIPIIFLNKLKEKVPILSNIFYQFPSKSIRLVGVTGTNGKTTVTHLLAQWVHLLGEESAVMGTIGNGLINEIYSSKNTTESNIEIQKQLSNFKKRKVSFVSMEISSHGLVQNRVDQIHFSAAVLTNISQDHLDYHVNLCSYKRAKWKFFYKMQDKICIMNVSDQTGLIWSKKLPFSILVSCSSPCIRTSNRKWLYPDITRYYQDRTHILFNSSWGRGLIDSRLIGEYNVENILLALSTLLSLGYPLKDLLRVCHLLNPICGRMEMFSSDKKPRVLLDYAHNPEAFKKLLITSRIYCKKKIWCIFGCGGNRDTGKRPIIGSIVEKYADEVVLTNDNPRLENPQKIIKEILLGFSNKNRVKIILDRRSAIFYALKRAEIEDLILVVGKGHENYQIFNKRKIKYSDRNVLIDFFKRKNDTIYFK